MPPQAAPFWLCHECGAQMRPIMVDNVPHCASCNSEFLEILDEEVNPDPFHELPHPPLRPNAGPPPVPPRPASRPSSGGGEGGNFFDFLGSLLGGAGPQAGSSSGSPPTVPPRPDSGPGDSAPSGPRTRTFNWGNASFTVVTGSGADVFGAPPRRNAPVDPGDDLDAYFRGFGAAPTPPQTRPGQETRPLRPEEASGALFLQALFDMLAEDGGAPGVFPGRGQFGDYVMTDGGYADILERLMQAAGPQGPLPASEAVINGLPRVKFDEKALEESQFKDCPICMEDFVVTDIVIRIPCKHIFHPDCLIPWLKSNGSCPVCRFSLLPSAENDPPSADMPSQGENPNDNSRAQEGNQHRHPLAAATDFISNTVTSTLHRLFGQSGAATGAGEQETSTPPPETEPDSMPQEDDRERIEQFRRNLEAASVDASWPEEYAPGVAPGPRREFVRRLSTLSNSFVPPEEPSDEVEAADASADEAPNTSADTGADDPPDEDLGNLDPADDVPGASSPRTGFNPGNMSGLSHISSAIPADYRAMHAQREREQHEREERERQRATNAGRENPNYWDDVD